MVIQLLVILTESYSTISSFYAKSLNWIWNDVVFLLLFCYFSASIIIYLLLWITCFLQKCFNMNIFIFFTRIFDLFYLTWRSIRINLSTFTRWVLILCIHLPLSRLHSGYICCCKREYFIVFENHQNISKITKSY